MSQQLVRVGDTEFYVEVAGAAGPQTISTESGPLTLDAVRATIEAVATLLAEVWEKVEPDEATVGFGLKVVAKSGRLTGLIVEGGGEATWSFSLKWIAGDQRTRG